MGRGIGILYGHEQCCCTSFDVGTRESKTWSTYPLYVVLGTRITEYRVLSTTYQVPSTTYSGYVLHVFDSLVPTSKLVQQHCSCPYSIPIPRPICLNDMYLCPPIYITFPHVGPPIHVIYPSIGPPIHVIYPYIGPPSHVIYPYIGPPIHVIYPYIGPPVYVISPYVGPPVYVIYPHVGPPVHVIYPHQPTRLQNKTNMSAHPFI